MFFPPFPPKHATIGLIAPSSPIPGESVDDCVSVIKRAGHPVVVGKSVYSSTRGYSSGSARIRAEDINDMFSSPKIDVIWCVRGGDSSIQILPYIDYELIKRNRKVFIGYSDVTCIHCAIQKQCDLVTFHGPMVYSNLLPGLDDFSVLSLKEAVFMGDKADFRNPPDMKLTSLTSGSAEGTLTGGNLSLIVSLIGTPWECDTCGKILFLEDVDEPVAKLDRMLHQLLYAGSFDKAAGILIGTFTRCENPDLPQYTAHKLIQEFFSDFKIPVIADLQAGHCTPKCTLPLGTLCTMDCETGKISFRK